MNDTQDKVYPAEATKIVVIKKEGYNSVTQLRETPEGWEFQLYNPNVKKEEEAVEEPAPVE